MYDSSLNKTVAEKPSATATAARAGKSAPPARRFALLALVGILIQGLVALLLGPWIGLPLMLAHLVGFAGGLAFAVREYVTGDFPRSENTCDQLEAMGRFIIISGLALGAGLGVLALLPGGLYPLTLQTAAMLVSAGLAYSGTRRWVV